MIDELLPETPTVINSKIGIGECPLESTLCSKCPIYPGLADRSECPGLIIWEKYVYNIKELL